MSLRDQLIEIRERVQSGAYPSESGICDGVAVANLHQLQTLWRSWPRFSGVRGYPVPGTPLRNPPNWDPHEAARRIFRLAADKWDPETRYGRDRRELLDWLIEQTEA